MMRAREDDSALQIMAKTTKETDDRWKIGLLWRNENVKLLESKRLRKDDRLRGAYQKIRPWSMAKKDEYNFRIDNFF